MKAYESLNPSNLIEDATVLAIRWGDDTPSYHVIPTAEWLRTEEAAIHQGATTELIQDADAIELQRRHAWIGIKLCSVGGVAAWGRAVICGLGTEAANDEWRAEEERRLYGED